MVVRRDGGVFNAPGDQDGDIAEEAELASRADGLARQSMTAWAVRTKARRCRWLASPRNTPARALASGDAASGGRTVKTRRVRAAGIFESPATTVSAPGSVAARSMGATSVPNPPLLISMSRSVRSGNW